MSTQGFTLPDYSGGSIANLMRTLADACGAPPPVQPPLAAHYGINPMALSHTRNIILIVVDGLGARKLEQHGTGLMRQHAGKRLSSVFPSTTAAAIPSFMTGLMPAQHALTGWHMWLEETQAITAVLPLTPRTGPLFSTPREDLPQQIFDHHTLYAGMHRPAWVISPQEIAGSPFNQHHSRGADTLAYSDLTDMMETVAGMAQIPGRKFIYAYWPTLDTTSHHFGTDSKEAHATLQHFCQSFDLLLESIAGTDTQVFVTADHGFIDSPESRVIQLDDLPELADMLMRPLCGEQRVAWCYLKAGAASDFPRCVQARLGNRVELVSREQMLAEHWFGPGPIHPKLASRIGDVALVMQDDWSIKDWMPGERRYSMLGVHGGTSINEMQVPLIAVHV
ncbi:MAG: alkaline phosphatase family protein [Zoogloeaceae bacterium]|nr:alkaline phosphatase family protein [Zoogloeaceae bacterium]